MGMLKEFSIQLYSVREETEKDFAGTVRKIAELGYTGVEFAGYGGLSAVEMKKLLEETKLRSVGSHVSIENLETNLDFELEFHHALGTKYIICPYAEMSTRDDVMKTSERLLKVADKIAKSGFVFAYHNHDAEFNKDGDKYHLDLLVENVGADKLKLELDVFWTAFAGVDYKAYIQKNVKSIELLHVKQMKDSVSKQCVDLNQGMIDFKELIGMSKDCGIKEFVLEQEEFEIDSNTSLKNNIEYIMSL